MLAPRSLPVEYKQWNEKWGAPFGSPGFGWPLRGTRFDVRRRGPFAWQDNNSTREYEYPWAYEQVAKHGSGLTVVDIGGSLGGMQFVLASEGHRVITVDPGLKASGLGWDVDLGTHGWLSKRMGVSVEIVPETLAKANLPSGIADVVLCISSLEHFSQEDVATTAAAIPRIMKASSLAVLTVDCFLDLQPFTRQARNRWGSNISIHDFLKQSGLALHTGKPEELVGFPEFSSERILCNLSEYYVGATPCLAQCFTAKLVEADSSARAN